MFSFIWTAIFVYSRGDRTIPTSGVSSCLGDLVAIKCLVYPGALLSSKTHVMFVEEKGRDEFARVSF
jgi:hypothetical protein